jgi:hypothetical protein
MSRALNDIVAEAIRADGSDLCDQPWAQLSAEKKAGWIADADRAIDCIGYELADILRVVYAAQAFVDDLPIDDVGEHYVCENNNGETLAELVRHSINATEEGTSRLLAALGHASKARAKT